MGTSIAAKLLAHTYTLACRALKLPFRWVPAVSILLFACYYILDPRTKSHINVTGSMVVLELPSFNTFDLALSAPTRIKAYSLTERRFPGGASLSTPLEPMSTPVNQTVASLTITNSQLVQPPSPISARMVHIYAEGVESIGIEAVRLDGKDLPLRRFFEENVKSSKASYIRLRYIRKDLAKLVFNWNDFVSNWILTGLVAGLSFLGIRVALLEFNTYVCPNRFFRRTLENLRRLHPQADGGSVFDLFAADCLKRDTLFQYLQLFGPALGFLLTVSSLIEALYPTRLGNDLEGFLAGIHVALISTFLGLLMRFFSLEGARVNDHLCELFRLHIGSLAPPDGPGVVSQGPTLCEPLNEAGIPLGEASVVGPLDEEALGVALAPSPTTAEVGSNTTKAAPRRSEQFAEAPVAPPQATPPIVASEDAPIHSPTRPDPGSAAQ